MRQERKTPPARFAAIGIALSALLPAMLSARAVPGPKAAPTGEQIFRNRCASCHGPKGEGTSAYRSSLTGTKSVGQLTSFIARSMPPGPVKKCAGEDAKKVAGYIYDAFYSPIAQARNRPARIELSRLTVRQYRNAVADLIATFRPGDAIKDERGLRGEYFKLGRYRSSDRALERVDPQIRFDFGTGGALPEQADPYQFAIRWQGSVIAQDTGEYEFIVKTEHAAQLWVNDLRKPLIDALVKSGNDNEYRGTIFLLGGRAYPIRLDFSKGVQGVDDLSKLKKKPPASASLSLEWRPPKRIAEIIPQRCLCPVVVPETFAVTTPFPPDDRSIGYERGTSVSRAWDEAATDAALETAGYVAAHLRELSGVADDAADRPAKLRDFCRRFVERAFRRPLTDDLAKLYIDRQFQQASDLETAVKRVVILALNSPRFLYREPGSGPLDSYAVASRLSFGLWDSLPDDGLLKAAAAGELKTPEQVAQQALRMLADPRAWSKLRQFLVQWLKVENYPDLAKDPKKYPEFDQQAASDLRTSFELFLQQTAWSDRSDFRDLFTSDDLYLNGRLAKIYGAKLPPTAPFQKCALQPTERAGLLTHPYLMATFAYLGSSSPIHRGVLLARNILGRTLKPPPQAFVPLPAAARPDLTTRERVALQTRPPACAGCHGMINPLGFTMEKFDAIGRLQTTENGKPIDASGSYRTSDGKTVTFSGVRDLADFLVHSEDAHSAFVEKLFQYLVKQPIRAYGPNALADLRRAFEQNQFSIRREMVAMMAESALKR